ncbi:MAG: extracellular solute-binding protein [Defluviimonas sp.]|uniref:ABC transporter substrate-binding protein n=1 Tax=Albidovulum sp. TaxID=1872424 RepID=UPI001D8B1113|nr:extracellular solute-binding protein [Paracoccaceae bacterium]MCC0064154.1 extracellular solute-binding protein [Defluviimonas sp.]
MQRIKFIDKMYQGKLSRRQMMQAASAFGVGSLFLPRQARAAEVLTCLEWGGYDAPEYFQAYVDKYGAQPNFSIFAGEEDALAKVLAGFAGDVMHPCNYSVARFVNAGVTKEIDTSRLTHWPDIFPNLQTAEGVVWDGKVVMAPADWGNSSLAYRPDLMDDDFKADPTWEIFYDEKYAGRVSMSDNEIAITIGAMVGGMPYDEAYKLEGAALEAAAKEWGTKAVNVSKFLWTDSSEVQQAMASGEIIAAYAWNDLVANLRGQGIPVEFSTPKEGMFTWFCGLTLLNTGKADEQAAYDFIDAWLSPETGKTLIEGSGYGHANMKSFEIADPEALANMGITDPIEMMKHTIVFKTPSDAVQEGFNKVWADTKALKY